MGNKTGTTKHASETRRLRYCNACSHVWEDGDSGRVLRYRHLPTWGLPRNNCGVCKKIKKHKEKKVWQITKPLYLNSLSYLEKESKRLEKKGWTMRIIEDSSGEISLWRVS